MCESHRNEPGHARCRDIIQRRLAAALCCAFLLSRPVYAETFTNPIIGAGADLWVTQ